MNYVGLMDRNSICPSFIGWRALSWCPTAFSLWCQMSQVFL